MSLARFSEMTLRAQVVTTTICSSQSVRIETAERIFSSREVYLAFVGSEGFEHFKLAKMSANSGPSTLSLRQPNKAGAQRE